MPDEGRRITLKATAAPVAERRTHTRGDLAGLVDALASWETRGGHVAGLHAGDVGWHLRQPDGPGFDHTVHGWWDADGVLVAAALLEGAVARPRVAPDRLDDPDVCRAVADAVDEIPADEVWTDAQPGSLLRTQLVARGWSLDPDPWLALHRDLQHRQHGAPGVDGADDAVAGVTPTSGKRAVAERVAVQRAAFDGSSFTVAAWARMAAGPGFDPDLDLLARAEGGTPVAAGTAWSAGPGRPGILEPVGTSRTHRGAGHGRRVVRALAAALASKGASGVSVCTPADNTAAVALYASAGLRPVETVQALTRTRR